VVEGELPCLGFIEEIYLSEVLTVGISPFFFTVHQNYLSAAISLPASPSSSSVQLRVLIALF
jgi:hypothetical protein